jgi:predicted dehydrogenase
MKKNENSLPPGDSSYSRRSFIQSIGFGAAALSLHQFGCSPSKQSQAPGGAGSTGTIAGFEKTAADAKTSEGWQPVSDRKIKVGLIGYGVCKFASAFGFQDHPNVEITAVSDLYPDRCAELARITGSKKTYPSLEELVKDKEVEAVFIATDAPSHAKHVLEALKYGKDVACAVPAVFGSLEDADKVYEAVKRSGKKYMMFETSAYHNDVYAMRELYKLGHFGKIVYSEGEYYHYFGAPLDGYKNWREGLIPQWYPTHSNGYYVCVTGERFTDVSCLATPSHVKHLQPANNLYKNPFGTEVANMRTSEGGMARMVVSWDTPGFGAEAGRVRGEKGTFDKTFKGLNEKNIPVIKKPPLPPGMDPGGHGGSHGYLTNEFITSLLTDRTPLVDISMALNLTVPGIIAHQSALKNGEWMKIPQYSKI